MKAFPTEEDIKRLDALIKAAGNIFDGTFDRKAYEKALAYYREIMFTKEVAR